MYSALPRTRIYNSIPDNTSVYGGHSSQAAEPRGEPRKPILTDLLSRDHVTSVKSLHLSGPQYSDPHTGYSRTHAAGLCKEPNEVLCEGSMKAPRGTLGRSHSQPSFGNFKGSRLSSGQRQCQNDKTAELPRDLEEDGLPSTVQRQTGTQAHFG